ncbi:hypothetical protein BFG57_09565 [Bacillus solimangrovi]|uniref:Uncharacterized protein n=1 Tax=Bacillus solimangrovi TaxID=1305675 RepID=A0A1E5LJ28_9BACI|nr:hypothetical protein BFG57_09565 [Bacillus solimangrovi]
MTSGSKLFDKLIPLFVFTKLPLFPPPEPVIAFEVILGDVFNESPKLTIPLTLLILMGNPHIIEGMIIPFLIEVTKPLRMNVPLYGYMLQKVNVVYLKLFLFFNICNPISLCSNIGFCE